MKLMAALVALSAAAFAAAPAPANEFKPQIEAFFAENIKGWLSDPAVIDAIKAQNAAHVSLSGADIESLDQTWRAEAKAGGGGLVDKVLSNPLSGYLKERKQAHDDAITEIFVMDNKGLNVGQSDITSDYMQGDEGKFLNTFGSGKDTLFIDDVEFDESTQSFQSQVSSTIIDPATGQLIGAITVGLNVEQLL